MKQHYPKEGLDRLCRLFGHSRQAYYKNQLRQDKTLIKEALVLGMVKEVRTVMPRIGTPKLRHILSDQLMDHRIRVGRDSFYKLLRDNNLLIKPRKRYYACTTDSNHHFRKWPDLTGGLKVSTSHRLWVSDITYLRTGSGFLYLSLITDAYSRKIIGHHLSYSLSARGCVSALSKAIAQLPKDKACRNLIHHSDRGIQYCCDQYVSFLQTNGIAISMTQNGSPYENAMAERVNGILKTELGLDAVFAAYPDALRAVTKAIDTYNRLRPHLSLHMQTPEQVHHLSLKNQPINPKQPLTNTDLSTSFSRITKNCQPLPV